MDQPRLYIGIYADSQPCSFEGCYMCLVTLDKVRNVLNISRERANREKR